MPHRGRNHAQDDVGDGPGAVEVPDLLVAAHRDVELEQPFLAIALVEERLTQLAPEGDVGRIELEAADLMVMRAAWLYDQGKPCGAEANGAKYLAAEAGYRACETAVLTHGGMGYSKEFHVERYLREVMLTRIAPISPQMILNFIAEKALGLPKSY